MDVTAMLLSAFAPSLTKSLTKLVLTHYAPGLVTDVGVDGVAALMKLGLDKATAKKAVTSAEETAQLMVQSVAHAMAEVKLDKVNTEALAHEVARAVEGVRTPKKLLADDLDPANVATTLATAHALPEGHYNKDEHAFYDRTIQQLSIVLVAQAPKLDGYVEARDGELLQRLRSLHESQQRIATDLAGIRQSVTPPEPPLRDELRAAYRIAVKDRLDELDLFGAKVLDEAKNYTLSTAYISLNLESETGENQSGRRMMEEVLDGLTSRRLLIRGEAGCGKTTLLKWIAINCKCADVVIREGGFHLAAERISDWDIQRLFNCSSPDEDHVWSVVSNGHSDVFDTAFVDGDPAKPDSRPILPWSLCTPFYLRLRDCVEGQMKPLAEYAAVTAGFMREVPRKWIEDTLLHGMGLVLLDGIDEVPPKHRAEIHKQVAALMREYPKSIFILTTRPLSEGEPPWLEKEKFQCARIAPMNRADRAMCIDRWHETIATARQRPHHQHLTPKQLAEKLKTDLNTKPELARLATNPLLCAMMCAIHYSVGELPQTQFELLEALVDLLLFHREQGTPNLKSNAAHEVWRELTLTHRRLLATNVAHYMVMQDESALPEADVSSVLASTLDTIKDRSKAEAKTVLFCLMERSGMLREKSPGSIDFIHNTFKDHLAALRFVHDGHTKILAENAHKEGWENIAIFAAAAATSKPKFAEDLVKRLMPGVLDEWRDKEWFAPKDNGAKKTTDSEALRYRRRVAAARIAAASGTKLPRELEARVDSLREHLFPPRTMAVAAGLAAAGNAILKYVLYNPDHTPEQRARCLRTLRLMETEEAREAIKQYEHDLERVVLEEYFQAVDPLTVPAVYEAVVKNAHGGQPASPLDSEPARIGRAYVRDLQSLTSRESISSLNLAGTQIGDPAIAQLAYSEVPFVKLTSLILSRTRITDKGLALLAAKSSPLYSLVNLELSETEITDQGLALLAAKGSALTALTTLDLTYTQITDQGLAALVAEDSPLTALTSLFLGGTKITDKGITALASVHSPLTALNSLQLSGTTITDQCLAVLTRRFPAIKIAHGIV